MLVSPLQFSNAAPILVTLSGMSMLVRLLQPEKAEYPMETTPFEMLTLVNPLQYLNAELPMLATLPGMSMLVRLLQP